MNTWDTMTTSDQAHLADAGRDHGGRDTDRRITPNQIVSSHPYTDDYPGCAYCSQPEKNHQGYDDDDTTYEGEGPPWEGNPSYDDEGNRDWELDR